MGKYTVTYLVYTACLALLSASFLLLPASAIFAKQDQPAQGIRGEIIEHQEGYQCR